MTAALPNEEETLGHAMAALVEELYPICRSITGEGLRETLRILAKHVPLEMREVPTGTAVLDWNVPREWNIRDAWIKNAEGERVVDFRASNLHVVNYSIPIRARLTLEELRPHLHALADRPDWIPYRTSYYEDAWGFCLSQRQLESLIEGTYEVCIDSSLEPGSLTYGELVLPGATEDEILISTHLCHPSLCDDNLSGVAVSLFLARELARSEARHYTMRFLYAPGTIGANTWLAQNREKAQRIKHGLTLTCLGDDHLFTYKRTVAGNADIDRAAAHVLAARGSPHQIIDFFPYGYDERQYNSPGFRLRVGSLMRGRHLAPWGEPQLGKRGLYRALGGTDIPNLQLAMLWVLNLSDGEHSLLDIAERAKMDFRAIRAAADLLLEHDLLAQ